MRQLNWDNLRYLLVLSSEGSIAAAARVLKVNRSTVLRRLNSFQKEMNCELFVRSDSGYSLTAEAEKIIALAHDVDNNLLGIQRKISGKELKLEGDLHITSTDSIMVGLLGPILKSFQNRHPKIVLHVHVTNQILNLSRQDADVAIRPTLSPPDHLVGKKLIDLDFYIYATKDYIEASQSKSWTQLNWIGFDANFNKTPPVKWVDDHVENNQIVMRCDSFVAVKVAVEASMGVALLPDSLGDSSANLVRIDTPKMDQKIGLWILTRPDLIRSAKVHAFYDFVKSSFEKM